MKKILLLSAISGSTLIADDVPAQHTYTPKTFWRTHQEGGYTYETFGVGLEYCYYRPEGLNFTMYGHSNFVEKQILLEHQVTFSFNKLFGETLTTYPLFSFRSLSHKIGENNNGDLIVQKSIGYLGYGVLKEVSPFFELGTELKLFRDIHNSLYCKGEDNFYGKKFENPFGWGIHSHLKYSFSPQAFVKLGGSFNNTFEDCYTETEVDFTFSWRF